MRKVKNLSTFILLAAVFLMITLACKDSSDVDVKPAGSPAPSSSSPTSPSSSFANKVKIKTPDDKTALEIAFDGGGAKIEYGGKTVNSESKDTEKRKYYISGKQIAEVKVKDADGFKVRTIDGKLLWKVKIADGKIKISDNEENQNAYELIKKDDGAKVEQSESKIGEVKFYADRGKIKVKDASDNEVFDGNTDKYSVSYGALLLDKIPEEQRYIIIAELLMRGL